MTCLEGVTKNEGPSYRTQTRSLVTPGWDGGHLGSGLSTRGGSYHQHSPNQSNRKIFQIRLTRRRLPSSFHPSSLRSSTVTGARVSRHKIPWTRPSGGSGPCPHPPVVPFTPGTDGPHTVGRPLLLSLVHGLFEPTVTSPSGHLRTLAITDRVVGPGSHSRLP